MPFATYIIGTARFVHGQSLKCSYQQSKNVTRNSCAKYASLSLQVHQLQAMVIFSECRAKVMDKSQLIVNVVTIQHRTCNCIWFVTVFSLCDFAYRSPFSRPIWSILAQLPWGTKSKYNSRNRDSNTFQSFHIPSKSLQWF